MAKTPVTNEPLVYLSFGYWAKFIVPAAVAGELVQILSDPRVVRVDSSDNMYLPIKHEWSIQPVDQTFISDMPVGDESDELRKGYLAWVKTKRELVGKSYIPEPFSVYQQARDQGETS